MLSLPCGICDSSGDLWHMCEHTLFHFVCSKWLSDTKSRSSTRVSGEVSQSRQAPVRPGPLHPLLIFGLLALLGSLGSSIVPIAVSPEEQLDIHSGKLQPENIYLVGSGSTYLWKGLPTDFFLVPLPQQEPEQSRHRVGAPCNSSPGRSGREAVTRLAVGGWVLSPQF